MRARTVKKMCLRSDAVAFFIIFSVATRKSTKPKWKNGAEDEK